MPADVDQPDKPKKNGPSRRAAARAARKARLADALRQNLRRRKAQQRARTSRPRDA